MSGRREVGVGVLFGTLGFGVGLLLARGFPAVLWPLALLSLGVWLARWPQPQVWLLALAIGGTLASPFGRPPDADSTGGGETRRYLSTPEQTRAWAGMRTLAIRNSAGDVNVVGGSPPRLRAVYTRAGEVGAIPAALLTEFVGRELHFTGLEPNWPQERTRGVRAALHASVPRRVALKIGGRIGDVMVTGVASARVDTNIGDVTLSAISGTAVALTSVGNVMVAGAGGGIEARTQVGDIWLEPDAGDAPILATADVGDIALVLSNIPNVRVLATSTTRGLPAGMTRLSPTRGELVLGTGKRLVVLETRIGEISVVRR